MRTVLYSVAALLMLMGCSAPVTSVAGTSPITQAAATASLCADSNSNPIRLAATKPTALPLATGCQSDAKTTAFYTNNLIPMALTIWGESRGEGERGMRLVGDVILNRLKSGQWGDSVQSVVTAANQFSPWAKGSASRRKLESLRAKMQRSGKTPDDLKAAVEIAEQLLVAEYNKSRNDQTMGAMYFHAKAIKPAWSKANRVTVRYGGHVFVR